MKYPKTWKITLRHRTERIEKTILIDWNPEHPCLTRQDAVASAEAWWPEYEVLWARYEPPVKPSAQQLNARRARRLGAELDREVERLHEEES